MYIHLPTLNQVSETNIREAYPHTSFSSPFLPPEGYAYIFPSPKPVCDVVTQTAIGATPVLTDKGHWEECWTVIELYPLQADKEAAVAAHQHALYVATIPTSVTMRQARRALLAAGLLPNVNAVIAGMTGEQGDAARIDWEFSSEVVRKQPLILALAPALGMSALQIDALFIAAAKL